jgi:hypothetical protein
MNKQTKEILRKILMEERIQIDEVYTREDIDERDEMFDEILGDFKSKLKHLNIHPQKHLYKIYFFISIGNDDYYRVGFNPKTKTLRIKTFRVKKGVILSDKDFKELSSAISELNSKWEFIKKRLIKLNDTVRDYKKETSGKVIGKKPDMRDKRHKGLYSK